MSNYNLTKMAVDMYCPGNVVQLDDVGQPSILVYIPAFKNSDVLAGGDDNTHPAFIVNGKEIAGFYYSKYENVVHNGRAYSLPGETPHAPITFEKARECCEAKGYGWHLSTAAEWAAIALWCKKNGFLPYGNNNNGKDNRESNYKAIPASYNDDGTIAKVAAGTGPLTWSHDGTASGIWDMNGNVIEWQGGIRIVWGELQLLANNDAADPDNPQNATSTCWRAINAADGSLVEPENTPSETAGKTSGNTVRLDFRNDVWTYSSEITSAVNTSRNCKFADLACADEISESAKQCLRALALFHDEGAAPSDYEEDYIHWNNCLAECCAVRGGLWSHMASSGLFSLLGYYSRTGQTASFGFRAAYIPYI